MKDLKTWLKENADKDRQRLDKVAGKCPTSTRYAFDRGCYLGSAQAFESVLKWLEKRSDWIPVTERLPERFQPVIFVVSGSGHYHGKVYGGQFQGLMFEGTSAEYPGFSIPGIEFSGSHWQPLPDPPVTGGK